MRGEPHLLSLSLELGKLPPVVDCRESLPQEEGEQPEADDRSNHPEEYPEVVWRGRTDFLPLVLCQVKDDVFGTKGGLGDVAVGEGVVAVAMLQGAVLPFEGNVADEALGVLEGAHVAAVLVFLALLQILNGLVEGKALYARL